MVDRFLWVKKEASETICPPLWSPLLHLGKHMFYWKSPKSERFDTGGLTFQYYVPLRSLQCNLREGFRPLSTHGCLEEMGPTSFQGKQMLHRLQAIQCTMHTLVAARDRCDWEGEHAKIIHGLLWWFDSEFMSMTPS